VVIFLWRTGRKWQNLGRLLGCHAGCPCMTKRVLLL